jgi:hypothetical protein
MHVKKSATRVSWMTICLLVSSAVSQTAQPATATLTPEEREAAFKVFQTTHNNFIKSISGLSQKQWSFNPAPDRWSVAEVAEHITVSETTIMGLIQHPLMQSPAAPEKREQVKGKDQLILEKMPEQPQGAGSRDVASHRTLGIRSRVGEGFRGRAQANMDYIRTTKDDLRDHFFDHPAFGPLDGYQWLLLIGTHSARHTGQIEEVRADPNFPKE